MITLPLYFYRNWFFYNRFFNVKKNNCACERKLNTISLKVFILPRVAELFIHKEKQN